MRTSVKSAILNQILSPSKAVKIIQNDQVIAGEVKAMLTAQKTVQNCLGKDTIFPAVLVALFGNDDAKALSEVEVVLFLASQLPENTNITGANMLECLLRVGKRTKIKE